MASSTIRMLGSNWGPTTQSSNRSPPCAGNGNFLRRDRPAKAGSSPSRDRFRDTPEARKPRFPRTNCEIACEGLNPETGWWCAQSYANPSPCYLANIRVIFQNNSEPAAESVKKACSTGISRISHQFDIREEQGAPNCPNTERALANWEAGK